MCRINPRVDFAFKKLFGSDGNQDLLISLLNAILSEEPPITQVVVKNPYSLAAYKAGKMSILDIKAQDENGRWFNVEMQISEDYHFDKRAIYYWAKLVTEQLTEGMMYKELQKTFSINILDFNIIFGREEFHNRYKILNTSTKEDDEMHDMFELHYLELRKFHKPYHELASALDRWSSFLTRAHALDKNHLPPELDNDPAIKKAVHAVDRMFDEEERAIYEVRMEAIADVESKIASALDKGWEKGVKQGMAQGLLQGLAQGLEQGLEQGLTQGLEQGLTQGLEQGLEQGLAKGMERGRETAIRELAIQLLDVLDAQTVAAKTGLSLAEVEALKTN